MSDPLNEIVGFLSRWCLLAAAGLSALIVVCAALLAGSTTVDTMQARAVVSDAVWGPWKTPRVVGYLVSAGRIDSHDQFLAFVPGRKPGPTRSGVGTFVADVPDSGPGLHEVVLKGMPYGSFAFDEHRAICKVIAPRRKVFAIDARLVEMFIEGQGQAWRRFVSDLQTGAEVVLFHPGPADEYERLKKDIRSQYPGTPNVFSMRRRPALTDGIQAIHWTLSRGKGPRPEVITADAELAQAAAAKGFTVRWIAPGRTDQPEGGGPARYGSLGELKSRLLAGRPAREEGGQGVVSPTGNRRPLIDNEAPGRYDARRTRTSRE